MSEFIDEAASADAKTVEAETAEDEAASADAETSEAETAEAETAEAEAPTHTLDGFQEKRPSPQGVSLSEDADAEDADA